MIRILHLVIRGAVRILAVLMVIIILLSIGDVLYGVYQRLSAPPVFMLNLSDMFEVFGTFLAGLIAVETLIDIRPISDFTSGRMFFPVSW